MSDPRAYYNEKDQFAARWLRNLILAGAIMPGDVDERDIRDVRPSDLAGYIQCHFFAGIGIWPLALRNARWPDRRRVWTGSCPCQPFSAAGSREGFADERHLWPHWFHLIRICRPGEVLGEQVASKDGLAWLDLVSADMEGENYAFGAKDICAAGFGAPHIRQRLYFAGTLGLANGNYSRLEGWRQSQRQRAVECVVGADGVARELGESDSARWREGRARGSTLGQGSSADAASGTGGLADDHHAERRTVAAGRNERHGANTGWPQGAGHFEGRGSIVGLADLEGEGLPRRQHRGAPGEEARDGTRLLGIGGHGEIGGVADDNGGIGGQGRALERGRGAGSDEVSRSGSSGDDIPSRPGPTNGFWRDADWLLCRDGRWRPVGPGSFPLVNGAPARVGRLRGYGNALVEACARGFIESYLESEAFGHDPDRGLGWLTIDIEELIG